MSIVQRLRPRLWAMTVTLALVLVGIQGLGRPAEAAQFCGAFDTVDVSGKQYVIQNNVWGATTPQCIEATTSSTSFTVTSSGHNNTGGTPAAYPSVFRGCHWGNCTNGGGLPLRVDNIGTATSSWSVTTPSSGAWNVAYDLWFNSTSQSSPTQAPDGAELMIWLNSRGGVTPAGSIVASNVSIAGATWNIWVAQFDWRYIAYQRTSATGSVSNLNVNAFVQDSRARGLIQPTWFFIGAEAGFEIWQGGAGLASGTFTFNATAGGGTTTSTSTSTSTSTTTTTTIPGTTTTTRATTTTTGPPGGCRVAYAFQSVWQDGFVANLTVTNLATSAINGWTVRWTFNNNAQITNIWNATRTQAGAAVAATNLDYNTTIGANGGSQTFGFQASYSGTAPTRPTSITLNNTTCTVA